VRGADQTREQLIAFYKARNGRNGQEVAFTEELERVLNLPARDWEKRMEETQLHLRMTTAYRQPHGQQILKPIQAAAIAELHDLGGLLAPIGVGQGKTLITFLAPLVLSVARPILLVPASLKEKTYREFAKLRFHWIGHPSMRVESYEMLSQVNGADILTNYQPDMIICDECFVGETLVVTPEGYRRIDSLRPGDSVVGCDGVIETVEDCWSSEPSDLIELVVGEDTFVCTPNHPFLTPEGWINAGDLDVGSAVLQIVRSCASQLQEEHVLFSEVFEYVHERSAGGATETLGTEEGSAFLSRVQSESSHGDEESVLLHELFGQVADASTRNHCASSQPGSTSKDLGEPFSFSSREPDIRFGQQFTEDAREQSYGGPVCAQTSQRDECASRARGAYPCGAGWERTSFVESACVAGGSAGVACGEADFDRTWWRAPLHAGHLPRGVESGDRSRRLEPCDIEETADRRREGRVLGVARVARVARIQRGSAERSGETRLVYNLQVSGSRTYCVGNGIVVHNCHRLKNLKAAVTRRVHRYMSANPTTIFAGLSGSVMKRSLMDFWHLAYWALRHKMPLPRDQDEVEMWASVLDEVQDVGGFTPGRGAGDFVKRKKPGALMLFCDQVEESDFEEPLAEMFNFAVDEPKREKVRRAFQKRFRSSPGIVCSGAEKLDVSLSIEMLRWEMGAKSKEAIKILKSTGYSPHGDLITEASVAWMMTLELAGGFYYRWDPPAPVDWLTARRAWNSSVRQILDKHLPGLDSPRQIERTLTYGRYEDRVASDAYEEWVKIRGTFEPNIVAEWLDDSIVVKCAEWMHKTKGIVWVGFNAFGEQLSKVSGVGYCSEQGTDPNGKAMEDYEGGPVIASIMANSTGKNLQAWNQNLVTTPPSNGLAWEQLLGRTHRQGQQADTVRCAWVNSCAEHETAFRQAVSDARTISTTVGPKEQRILYADHIAFNKDE